MTHRHTIIILLAITIILVLSGCGRKGDLYLPETSTSGTPDSSQQQQQQEK